MKKMWVVLCVLAMVSLSAWAQNASKPGARAPEADSDKVAPPAVVKHVLKNLYNNTGDYFGGTTTVVGYNAIDSKTTVSCPGTSGTCLIQADQWVQLSVAINDRIGICLLMDGTDINGCPINSSVATSDYTVNTMSQGKTVPFGNHTVQTFVYDDVGGTLLAFYNCNYYVFKP